MATRDNCVATGAFTVEADREVVTNLAQMAVDSALSRRRWFWGVLGQFWMDLCLRKLTQNHPKSHSYELMIVSLGQTNIAMENHNFL